MNRPLGFALLAASLAAGATLPACGTVRDRQLCSDGGCAVGQYCGPAGACLPDTAPPTVTSVEVTPGAVRRDGAVAVLVIATDDQAVAAVRAALQLPGAAELPLVKGSAGWEGRLEVGAAGFPAFQGTVKVRVTARDSAGNEGVGEGSVEVTRALWSRAIGAPLTAAAVAPDGGAVLGVDRDQRQLVKVTPEGEVAWEVTVGTKGIVGAPAVGEGVVFVGGLDGNAYVLEKSLPPRILSACQTTRPISMPAAVLAGGLEGVLPSQIGSLYAVNGGGKCVPSSATVSAISTAAIDAAGNVYAESEGLLSSYQVLSAQLYERWRGSPLPYVGSLDD